MIISRVETRLKVETALSLLTTSKTELTAFLETGETNHLFLAQASQDRAIDLLQGLNLADVAVVGHKGK